MTKEYEILIIDNNVNNRDVFKTILKKEGYAVDTATNGEEAIQKTETHTYDLALIDCKLPDIDGAELLFYFRDNYPSMIKIIVTGFTSLEATLKTLNDGADGYLVKPVNIDELLLKISENLKKRLLNQKYNGDPVAEFAETKARNLRLRHLFREKC